MYRLLLISLLAVLSSVVALTDVDQQCIADNSEAWSNDNLIGTWYMIWKFAYVGAMVPSFTCPQHNYTRPSPETIQEFKNKYNDPNVPYNMDDNPVFVKESTREGLVIGHNIAKFYVPTPRQHSDITYFAVNAYRMLTPKYIMYTECALRGFTRWLMTTDRYAPVAEIQELIKNTPELNEMDGQRYCATY